MEQLQADKKTVTRVNHPPAKQVAWGLRPQRGLTVLQKPPNFGNRIQGEALSEPPPEEAAFALVNKDLFFLENI